VFWLISRLPLTPQRLQTLKHIVTGALLWVCATVVLTHFSIVPTSVFGAHLPKGFDVAGPWFSYMLTTGHGLGTISYNHSYTALQLLMLLALRIHLSGRQEALLNTTLLLLSLLACLISGSRAGFAAGLFFAVVVFLRKQDYFLALLLIAAFLVMIELAPTMGLAHWLFGLDVTKRQSTLAAPYKPENLSGRYSIWKDSLILLDQDRIRWVIGSGFGSATGKERIFAHMFCLQVILEMGLVGLLVFVLLAYRVLSYLHQYERGVRAIFWMTVVLLLSSLSQETFYPVPAFGHFIGFYLCALAIALRGRQGENENSPITGHSRAGLG